MLSLKNFYDPNVLFSCFSGDTFSDTASTRSGEQGQQGGNIPESEEDMVRAATVNERMCTEMYFT